MLELLLWLAVAVVAVGMGLLLGTIVAAIACGAHRDLPDTTDSDTTADNAEADAQQ